MKLESTINGLKKILNICNKNGFLNFTKSCNSITEFNYGPLGSLLKKNILKEWFASLLTNNDMQIFPVEITTPREKAFLVHSSDELNEISSFKDAIESFTNVLSFYGNIFPFGIAIYGPCIYKNENINSFDTKSDKSLLWYPQAWTRLTLTFLSPPKKALNWFYYLQRNRYRWWRKYSNIPSQFSMSDIHQFSPEVQQLSLLLEFPWQKQIIEKITLYGSKHFANLITTSQLEQILKNTGNIIPSIITCEMELDLAVFAYLCNAFAEKRRSGETCNVLQLHTKLTPYKLGICLESEIEDNFKKLNDIAIHLIKDLKNHDVMIFPYSELTHLSLPHQFKRNDELGIPYTLVLNETTLQKGITGLRSRDTTLQEKCHITELIPKLLKYLQIKVDESI